VVTVHAAVATATSTTSPTRSGRSRLSADLSTARHHPNDPARTSPSLPCARLRRCRVPSFRRAAGTRPCHQSVSSFHRATDAHSRPNGNTNARTRSLAAPRNQCSAAARPPFLATVSHTMHRAASYKTARISSCSSCSPPEPSPTTISSPKRRGAYLLPAARALARHRRKPPQHGEG
jgi:hypothetical protein